MIASSKKGLWRTKKKCCEDLENARQKLRESRRERYRRRKNAHNR